MARKLSHIGIAVADLEEAVRSFTAILGDGPDHYEEITDQKVKTAFFATGPSRVELLQATSPESPIARFVEKRGPGIHHVAFEVDDLEAELTRLKNLGMRFIDEKPRLGAEGALIAFIHPKSTAGILVELLQKR